MKYLRLFLTHALHEQEQEALEKLGVYTSYCEDKDEVTIFYLEKLKPKYAVGDYLLSSGEVIKNVDYTDLDVIGVCVIPDNFISKTGINSKARFCALAESRNYLKYKTSDTEDTELPIFNNIGCVGESGSDNWVASNILTHNGSIGFIPGQASHFDKTVENPYDPKTYWFYNDSFDGSDLYVASPYLYVNGEYVFNEGVYNGCVDDAVSMLSDMDGLANTGIINDSDHPAAQYCATYSTNGTFVGDWYLPAIGELAFIMPRFDTINSAITKVGGTPFVNDDAYWSSTLYSTDGAIYTHAAAGYVAYINKNVEIHVMPFIQKD